MEISPSKRWSVILSWNWHCVIYCFHLNSYFWIFSFFFFLSFVCLSFFFSLRADFCLEHRSACLYFKCFMSYQFVCATHNKRHLVSFKKAGGSCFRMLHVAGPFFAPSNENCRGWHNPEKKQQPSRHSWGRVMAQYTPPSVCSSMASAAVSVQRCQQGSLECCQEHGHLKISYTNCYLHWNLNKPDCFLSVNHRFITGKWGEPQISPAADLKEKALNKGHKD